MSHPPAENPEPSKTLERLRRFQEKLLDLSKRNRLLNFRRTRASTVKIVGELPAEVFRLLVESSRGLELVPAPEPEEESPDPKGTEETRSSAAAEKGTGGPPYAEEDSRGESYEGPPAEPSLPRESAAHDDVSDESPEDEDPAPAGEPRADGTRDHPEDRDEKPPFSAAPEPTFTREFRPYSRETLAEHHRDLRLQTDLDAGRLDHNLLRIYQQAQSSLEEQGFNTLFLALGALEWFDRDAPRSPLLAPVVLVPVELRRRSPRSPFLLHRADEDPVLNPSLAMKLERELGARLAELPDDVEDWDIQEIFVEIGEAVRDQPGWRIVNDSYLGLFAFTKFIMYKDLEAFAEHFEKHPLIRALCGEEALPAEASFPASSAIDSILDPESTYQVVDADSSQQEAILGVRAGANLVLEGPPGTGKSQTITNVIAESLAAGKRVLFVSEKMAALEVVYSRLEQAGLADFCLELHSRHASKRRVAEELGRTLALGRDAVKEPDSAPLGRVRALRERLNTHVEELWRPVEPLGISPFDAIGRTAALAEVPEVPAPPSGIERWTREEYDGALEALDRLVAARETLARSFPDAGAHPWRGSRLEELTYQGSIAIRNAVAALRDALGELQTASIAAARIAASSPPRNASGAARLADLVALLLETPHPPPESIKDPGWAGGAGEIRRIIEEAEELSTLRAALASRWHRSFLDADHDRLASEARARRGFLRFLQPGYWRLRRELLGFLEEGARLPRREALLEDLERGREAARARREVRAFEERGRRLFGPRWRNEESEARELTDLSDWMEAFAPWAREADDALLDLAIRGFDSPHEARERNAELRERIASFHRGWGELRDAARLVEDEAFPGGLHGHDFEEIAERLERMEHQVDALHDWGRHVAAERACRDAGLADFSREAERIPVAPADLVPAFERVFLRAWLDHALATRDGLRRFSRHEQETLIREFRELDLDQLRLARARLRARLLRNLPDAGWEASARSELGILQRELRRKRGHKPLRKLFPLIPNALARLKPCLLMSPLSVAQFIDPRLLRFDLVIFDEASQITPEDALGAIARGRQLVVVGDTRQLPPTAFFQKQEVDTPDDEDETPDLESILDECTVAGFPRRMLRWHYRSRHESLISFSNEHFYDGRLHTFPSSAREPLDLGVGLVHVPDGVFARGTTRDNPVEADRVAGAVLEHFRSTPELSLGVGTFAEAQQVAILDRLEELRRRDESLEAHFDPERPEHFFVKNLENIQGDERDVIFVSVGYARDARGKLWMSFGPINKPGGERRLNVLMTRARRRLVVFSSILARDVRADDSAPRGRRLLKSYLEYAERGGKSFSDEERRRAHRPSDFEEALARRLAGSGLEVERAVGLSRSRIGLAVAGGAPERRYLLGIDWDGTTYRENDTARDRDRLRQQVLEGLGWRIHRVWSAEWLRNPAGEAERVFDAVERARRGELEPEVLPLLAKLEDPPPFRERAGRARRTESGDPSPQAGEVVVPYVLAELEPAGDPEDFHRRIRPVVSRLVRVVATESPIHRDEAARRVAAAWGITRLSPSVEERVREAAARAEDESRLRAAGDFLWTAKDDPIVPRSRNGEGVPREPELIALEEIAELAVLVLERELRSRKEDLIARTARLLGFSRAGKRLGARVEAAIDLLIAQGRVDDRKEGLEARKPARG